jgi:hypothetical protein
MSKLAYTSCTSSLSSSASMSFSTFLAASAVVEGHGGGGHHRESADSTGDAGLLERGAHRVQVGRRGGDPPGVAVVDDVLGAGVEGHQHELVLVGGAVGAITTPLRSNCQATAPGSAMEPPFLEKMRGLGAGAVAVVGEHLDEHGHAVGA